MISIRLILIISVALLWSTNAVAQKTKYFRHVGYDSRHQYEFRVAVNDKDTAIANCYRVEYEKSGRRPVRWDYLKAGRIETDPTFGFGTALISYEDKSEKHAYFDALGRPTKSTTGDFAEKFKVEKGAESTIIFQYDRSGKLLKEDNNGCSRYLLILDDEGREIKEYCLNDLGIKIENNNGIYEKQYIYGEDGNVSEISYFGKDGTPMNYAVEKIVYDKKGNPVENTSYGSNGEPYSEGIAKVKRSYNAQGYETKRETFNAQGLLINRSEYKYDNRGNQIESRDYAADGELETGYVQQEYDKQNNAIKQTLFDAKGQIVIFTRNSFDAKGRQIKSRFFNADSTPTQLEAGYSIRLITYDPDDKWIEESYYDATGGSVYCNEGYAAQRFGFNEHGDITAVAYFDDEHNLIHPPGKNAALIRFEYDSGGKPIDAQHFNADGERIEPETTTTPPPDR